MSNGVSGRLGAAELSERRGSEISYPIVSRPGVHRILRREGVSEDQMPGLVSGGVYPWIPKEVFNIKSDKQRVQLIVNAIRSRREIEFKELSDKLIVPEETLEQKVMKRRNTSLKAPANKDSLTSNQLSLRQNDDQKFTQGTAIQQSQASNQVAGPSASKRPGLLPLGFGHLRIQFGGKQYQTKPTHADTDSKRTFKPIDCTLLVEDPQAVTEVKKLKSRVKVIDDERAKQYLVSLGLAKQTPVPFSPEAIAKEKERQAKKRSLLNPKAVQSIAQKAVESLSEQNPIFWSMDAKVDFKTVSKSLEKSGKSPKPHRGNVLFELLRKSEINQQKKTINSKTDRDLKLESDSSLLPNDPRTSLETKHTSPYKRGAPLVTTKSMTNLANPMQVYKSTLAESMHVPAKVEKGRFQPQVLRPQITDGTHEVQAQSKSPKVDVTRLPYLYISPSI